MKKLHKHGKFQQVWKGFVIMEMFLKNRKFLQATKSVMSIEKLSMHGKFSWAWKSATSRENSNIMQKFKKHGKALLEHRKVSQARKIL